MKRFWRSLLIILVAVLMFFDMPVSVMAISESEMYFNGQNGIYFYNPSGRLSSGCKYGTLEGSTLQEKVLSFLLSIGLNEIGAAGVYGNMMAEGLGAGILLSHENGTDSEDDIGTNYAKLRPVTYADVHALDDPKIMHGLGFIQWSFGRRVNLLHALADAGGLDKYAREWDSSTGRYVYDGVPYDELAQMIGDDTTEAILIAELEFFNSEHQSYKVTQDDISTQGLAKYGVTSGMQIFEALNLLSTPAEAAELFFSTSEMPRFVNFEGHKSASTRTGNAEAGYEMITSAGITASGVTECGAGGDGTIAATAVELAWPYEDGTCDDGGKIVDWASNKRACYDDIKPSYKAAMEEIFGNKNLLYYRDCGHFVSTVIHKSGADPNFPPGVTSNMMSYLSSSSEWQEIPNLNNTSNLEPGDVFVIVGSGGVMGHIMIYTGSYSQYGNMAAASYNDWTGKMQEVQFTDFRGTYRIFRKK